MNAIMAMLNMSTGAQGAGPAQANVSAQGSVLGGGKALAGGTSSEGAGEFAGILNAVITGKAQAAQGAGDGAALNNMLGAGVKPTNPGDQAEAVNYIQTSMAGVEAAIEQAQAIATDVQASADAAAIAGEAQASAEAAAITQTAAVTNGTAQVQAAVDGAAAAQAAAVTNGTAQAQAAIVPQAPQTVQAQAVVQDATAAMVETVIPALNSVVAQGVAIMPSGKNSSEVSANANLQTISSETALNPSGLSVLAADSPAVSEDVIARLNAFAGGGKVNPFVSNAGLSHRSGKEIADAETMTLADAGKPAGGAVQGQPQMAAKPEVAGSTSFQNEAVLAATIANSADDDAGQTQFGSTKGFLMSEFGATPQTASETVVKAQVAASSSSNMAKVIQVNDQAFSVVRSSKHSLELTLQPEGLGKLNLEVNVSKGVVTAHINAPDQASKDVIERNLQGIMEQLQKEGIEMGGFSVDVRKGNEQQVADESNGGEGRDNRSDEQKAEDEAIALAEAQNLNRAMMNADRLVSVYA